VEILVGNLKLPPPTSQQNKLKKTLVKEVFEATFPGETLNLAESEDSSPDLSEPPPGANQENHEASDNDSENRSNPLHCND
jgi:hypothetical protein